MQETEVTFLINQRTREITKLNGIKADLRVQGLTPGSAEFAKQLRMKSESPCPIFGLCERIEAAQKGFAST